MEQRPFIDELDVDAQIAAMEAQFATDPLWNGLGGLALDTQTELSLADTPLTEQEINTFEADIDAFIQAFETPHTPLAPEENELTPEEIDAFVQAFEAGEGFTSPFDQALFDKEDGLMTARPMTSDELEEWQAAEALMLANFSARRQEEAIHHHHTLGNESATTTVNKSSKTDELADRRKKTRPRRYTTSLFAQERKPVGFFDRLLAAAAA